MRYRPSAIMRTCDFDTNIRVNKRGCERCRASCPLNTLVYFDGDGANGGEVKDITVLYPFNHAGDYDGAFDNRMTERCVICGKDTNSGYRAGIGGGKPLLHFCRDCVVIHPKSLTLGLKLPTPERFEIIV